MHNTALDSIAQAIIIGVALGIIYGVKRLLQRLFRRRADQ